MSDQDIFLLMVFIVGLLLSQSFVRPLMGSSSQSRKRLRERIRNLSTDTRAERHVSLVRERYIKNLSPLELRLLELPGMDRLQTLLDQAGSEQYPHRLVMVCLAFLVAGGALAVYLFGWGLAAPVFALIAGSSPLFWMQRKRAKRLNRFEEQFGDALTIMARAMRAGLPFTEALKLVSQEMKEPAGKEFGIVFTEINYGGDARSAMLGLLERVPSVMVMAMVTSVMIQRETGGNLAELLDKLAEMMRTRFRFQRSLRTLTAEGRLAAWILSLLPFFMVGALTLINPEFIPMLTEDPEGRRFVAYAFVLLVIGVIWLRAVTKVDV
ncbi:type II secretion system F family protein [Thiorhodococcus minor]|uniref:Secretion system protein n=1 Tax=Thiorhodococcus minor TaxID=57489 RepID=A0A6M0K344_9GAMM|nr:type II secretion system F family protein [Thiorhodococcus minor]NEV63027.1 secretion system protein [Thiorhodococcus minor]